MKCFRKKTKEKESIATYINDMKNLDHTLDLMIRRVQQDIIRITKDQKPTKHLARRRLMYKRHIQNIENRRSNVLARILQLENLHLNEMQINSLQNIAAAHKNINISNEDVESLIDKLDSFKDDFEEVNELLTKDIDFNTDELDEEELMKELEHCAEEKEKLSAKRNEEEIKLVFPEVPKENKKDAWKRKFDEQVWTMGI
ncbi:MAG: hypothetical protein CMO44_17955 [Verrucomicrobiales bacterium]|nr:hypothetical protein [Verrucomicrobiales bacterium]